MKNICFLATLLLSFFISAAQKISGSVKDTLNKPVEGATVILYQLKDTVIVKISATDTAGKYQFLVAGAGNFYVAVSNTGYTENKTNTIVISRADVAVNTVVLQKSIAQLKEVLVISKKPMIEVKADRTIFNVEGSINAVGSDVMELLRKSPGVVVDREDNIIMSGKNGVIVYIDGRPSPLSGQALGNYLHSLQAASVEAIELITNPSAKYDAAGNAGIINIRLKKSSTIGTNGTVNAGYAIGINSKYSAGFSLNNRNKFTNVFGSYNYTNNLDETNLFVTRTQSDTGFAQKSIATIKSLGHNFKAGVDYFIDKHNTLGIIANGNVDDRNTALISKTPIIYIPTQTISRWLIANNKYLTNNKNINLNINYKHTGKEGKELSMDADYGHYNLASNQLQSNYYYNADLSVELSRNIYQMLAPSVIDIYSYRTDYEQNIIGGKLSAGAKFSYVKSDNNFDQFNIYSSSKLHDSSRSNSFTYKENINALYGNFTKQYKYVMLQLGLRLENSNIEGYSSGYKLKATNFEKYDSLFTRHYTDFFPNAAITFNKNINSQWIITYSRRIDRPPYQDMNPFEVRIDEYMYFKGNTELRPQYTNSIALAHAYFSKLNTRLSYSIVKDVFTRLLDTTESAKSFLIKKNIAEQKILNLNINYNTQYKWYGLFANINAFHSQYNADFGRGRTIDLSVIAVTINLQQTAKLGKGWTAEMSGIYNSPSIWSGTFKSKAMYGVDAGVQKKLFGDKATIRVAVSDVFSTMRFYGVSDFVGQRFVANYHWESRQLKANLTWSFGNASLKSATQRKTATDVEGKRVQQSSGGLSN